MSKKGIVSPQYALRGEFITLMQRQARRLKNISRAQSRRQWTIASMLLTEWAQHPDYAAEMTLDEFYCEASRVICDTAGFPLVTTTGETVKTWCEVYKHFEHTPEKMKAELAFEYFKQARWLCNHKFVTVAEAAIATALNHGLTADEMRRWYTGDIIPEPQVLEFRNTYSQPFWGLYDWIQNANGNKDQIIWHITEIQRLHEESNANND